MRFVQIRDYKTKELITKCYSVLYAGDYLYKHKYNLIEEKLPQFNDIEADIIWYVLKE